ncbi:MAG: helix-turn-helix transcriptional regulator [Dyadobacter sp.]|uniref:helix-turn-helix domain-containing protein n=1 Tax=Dyadobacter sp. TaxID=1914288 RepID=UPI0032654017
MSAGELLRRYRLENNLTQQQMANLLGISQAAYHKWESELTKIPIDRYFSISVVCNVKLHDMLPENWQKKINSE